MDVIKLVKPFETICPRCKEQQTTNELNFSIVDSGTASGATFSQSHLKCNGCGFRYLWRSHLKNPNYILEVV